MLHCILGRSGSGKTAHIFRALQQAVEAQPSRPLILLVPEQFSFESERALLQQLGVRQAAKVQVLSFTRLANRVFRETGGIAVPVMDDVTRVLMMSRALELHHSPENTDSEKPRAYDTGYVSSLLALCGECKQCAVTPRLLRATAENMPAQTLKTKLTDLASIFEIYEGLTQSSGIDPEDTLRILADKLPDSHLFDGAQIFVDGFKGFTAVELDILGLLLQKADMYVSLCTDRVAPDGDTVDCGLFAPVNRSLRQLYQLAEQQNITIEKPTMLTENHRAAHPALRALEAGAFSPRATIYEQPQEAVRVMACEDIHTECTALSRVIRHALRTQELRAGDIAVIVRNLSEYTGILDTALARADIPFYMDSAADIYTMPLVSLCTHALRICVSGYQADAVLSLLKTDLMPFDTLEISTLENYIFTWRIDGKRFEKPFTANPAGLTEWRKADTALLRDLEEMRRRIIKPLTTLKAALGDKPDGATFAAAMYAFLTDPAVAADKGVRRLYEQLEQAGEPHLATQTAKVWDLVMDILDRFAVVFKDDRQTDKQYAELFHRAAGLCRLPSIPQGLDAVQVGSADHVRLQSPKMVCILGANEGVFPAYPAEGNLLSDHERSMLEESGLFLSANRLQKAAQERFYAYTALAAPTDTLYISYTHTRGGAPAYPSALVQSVCNVFPQLKTETFAPYDQHQIESAGEALDALAAAYSSKNTADNTLYETLRELSDTALPLQVMARAADRQPHQLNTASAKQLFGTDMQLSASQADTFYRCHFQYFCRYGLRLQPRRIADIDASIFGTFSHYIMETLLPEYVSDTAPAPRDIPALQARIHEALFAYVENEMGGFADKPARFRYLLSLVERTCFSLLWFAINEIAQSRFKPADYELVVGQGGIPSPTLQHADGSISIVGKIDRVDIYRREDTVFVRVVDYKTGSKEFKLHELPYGINMQMLLYLFAVCGNGHAHLDAKTTAPAGILYMPAKDITLKNTRAPLDESRLQLMRMNGLLLRDADVLTAMEADGAGVFIPATVEDNLIGKNSDVVSRRDFENIRRLTETLLVNMAENLLAGDVAAVPTGDDRLPCEYCDFKTVCGRKQNDPARVMEKKKDVDVLAQIEQQGGGSDGDA